MLELVTPAGGLRRAMSDELPKGPFSTARRSHRPPKHGHRRRSPCTRRGLPREVLSWICCVRSRSAGFDTQQIPLFVARNAEIKPPSLTYADKLVPRARFDEHVRSGFRCQETFANRQSSARPSCRFGKRHAATLNIQLPSPRPTAREGPQELLTLACAFHRVCSWPETGGQRTCVSRSG